MRRQFNARFFLIVLAIVVVLGGSAFLVHGYMVRRNADMFLRQAEDFRKEGNRAKELECLEHYVNLRPDRSEIFSRYALLKAELSEGSKASKNEALEKLSEAMRREPENDDVR